jgi:hypothetical protein
MSEAPIAIPVSASPVVAAAAAPAKPLTAIQIVEQQIADFFRQKEHALTQFHALDGAIQGATLLLNKLRSEVEKAEAFAKAEAEKVEAGVKAVGAKVEHVVSEVKERVEAAVEAVEDKKS